MPRIKRAAGDFGDTPDFAFKHPKKFNAIISQNRYVDYIPSLFAHNNDQARSSTRLSGIGAVLGRQA